MGMEVSLTRVAYARQIVGKHRVFDLHNAVRFERMGDLQRTRQIPFAAQVERDLHLVARGFADALDGIERLLRSACEMNVPPCLAKAFTGPRS